MQQAQQQALMRMALQQEIVKQFALITHNAPGNIAGSEGSGTATSPDSKSGAGATLESDRAPTRQDETGAVKGKSFSAEE